MGGIWKHIPLTYALMTVGSLALAGIPPFAGHYSKDAILESAWAAGTPVGYFAYGIGVLAAFLTAFYSWRLLILTFHGKPRADEHVMAHVHESPPVMTVPLVVLAVGALFAGFLGNSYFVGEGHEAFWGTSIFIAEAHGALRNAEHVPFVVSILPLVAAVSGIGLAYLLYWVMPAVPARIARQFGGAYRFLLNKWYFDELYDFLFVKPAFRLGIGLWKGGDGALIDGVGPDGVAAATRDLARRVGRLETGYLYHYAFAMLIGVATFVTLYMLGLG
jgi:NADH-quinone oxidoreductase subunit L